MLNIVVKHLIKFPFPSAVSDQKQWWTTAGFWRELQFNCRAALGVWTCLNWEKKTLKWAVSSEKWTQQLQFHHTANPVCVESLGLGAAGNSVILCSAQAGEYQSGEGGEAVFFLESQYMFASFTKEHSGSPVSDHIIPLISIWRMFVLLFYSSVVNSLWCCVLLSWSLLCWSQTQVEWSTNPTSVRKTLSRNTGINPELMEFHVNGNGWVKTESSQLSELDGF